MKTLSFTALVVSVLLIQGCSMFTSPKENPIVEDKLGDMVGTLAMTPDRRVVIFNRKEFKFCAEPPADAADNLASSFATALEGSDGSINAKAEMVKTFASTAKQLFFRTQGVQLYRDGMYSLCQAFVNNAVTAAEFKVIQEKLLTESSKLIEKEIPELRYLKADNPSLPIVPLPSK